MGRISFFGAADAWIQRRFDAVCFRLMRRGWSKPRIRSFCICMLAVNFVAMPLTFLRTYGKEAWPAPACFALFVGGMLIFYNKEIFYKQEEDHDQEGPTAARRVVQAAKITCLTLFAGFWLFAVHVEFPLLLTAKTFSGVLLWLVVFTYLDLTPPVPPPQLPLAEISGP